MEKRCTNCAHIRCLFHGEDRRPVCLNYGSCWVDPKSEDGQQNFKAVLSQATDNQVKARFQSKINAVLAVLADSESVAAT